MIVVTGAAGFIGSNLVLGLNAGGIDDILAVDSLDEASKHRNLNRAEIADLIEPEALLAQLSGLGQVDCVFHQGACTDTTEADGVFMMRNNYRYSVTLASWCMARGIPFIYASSAAVYGSGTHGFAPERTAEDPLNVYAYSKFLFDQWVRRHGGDQALIGLRYFNVYGRHERHKGRMASVVHKFHAAARAGEPLQLFEGSEALRRDFVHVDDVVAVNLYFQAHPDKRGIYNVGCGSARSFHALAELVAARYGVEIEAIPFPEDLKGKYQAFTQADITGLRAAGYVRPFASLEEGVARTLDWLDA